MYVCVCREREREPKEQKILKREEKIILEKMLHKKRYSVVCIIFGNFCIGYYTNKY